MVNILFVPHPPSYTNYLTSVMWQQVSHATTFGCHILIARLFTWVGDEYYEIHEVKFIE
jgi:hypothetical protein